MPARVGQLSADVVVRTIARDRDSVRIFLREMTPVVHARVARSVVRRGTRSGQSRSVAEEVEDLVQEVFAALFDNDARVLRSWDSGRGLSIANFVGLVAEHQVANLFRSGKRRPWTDDLFVEGEADTLSENATGPEALVESRDLFATIVSRLRAELSPRGLELFYSLIVEDASSAQVAETMGLSLDAVYAWRSRLTKLVRAIAAEVSRDFGAGTGASESERHGERSKDGVVRGT
jgi:RNA polymerase sigma factor (sigma-70 family)